MPGQNRSGIFVYRFFIRLCWASLLWVSVQLSVNAACPPPDAKLEAAQLAVVIDGDTLLLEDRRKVRLLDINTPELGREGRPDEAFAREAKRAVENWLGDQGQVFLNIYGKDRYNRHLAEVYRSDGDMLSEYLLGAGLGWRILVPPYSGSRKNLDRPCLYRAEAQARSKGWGLWSQAILETRVATRKNQGFTLMRGRVEKLERSRYSTWIELDGDVVLHIADSDLHWFKDKNLSQWQGQNVEVRGWLRARKPPRPGLASLQMDLRHPAMIRLLEQ